MMNFISYIMIGMVILACASDRMVFDAVIEEENASSETQQASSPSPAAKEAPQPETESNSPNDQKPQHPNINLVIQPKGDCLCPSPDGNRCLTKVEQFDFVRDDCRKHPAGGESQLTCEQIHHGKHTKLLMLCRKDNMPNNDCLLQGEWNMPFGMFGHITPVHRLLNLLLNTCNRG